MNILADENLDEQMVERLRQDGHSVLYIAELSPSISDNAILRMAKEHDAVILTHDRDFGELVFRQSRATVGVLLMRIHRLSRDARIELVSATLQEHGSELKNSFAVLSPGNLRIRHTLAGSNHSLEE